MSCFGRERSYHIATKRFDLAGVHAARNNKSIGLRIRLSRLLSKSSACTHKSMTLIDDRLALTSGAKADIS